MAGRKRIRMSATRTTGKEGLGFEARGDGYAFPRASTTNGFQERTRRRRTNDGRIAIRRMPTYTIPPRMKRYVAPLRPALQKKRGGHVN
jgi:hypothetical protein